MDGSIRSRDGRGARYSAILSRMHGTYADARTECPGGDQMTPSAYDQWLALYEASAQRDATFSTMSGVALAPVYGPENSEFPGQFPYTRGVHAGMYRSRLWTMRMFAGFGTAIDTNRRFKEIIAAGGQGLSTAFDMPTLLGLDSDDPMALGEVGRCGVAIDSLRDMRDLFADIDLATITTSMTINSPAAVMLALFVAQAEESGVARAQLGGTLQNDILKEYQAQKEFVFPPRLSFFFNAHIDFFEEIAKYRAARRLWATWMRGHYAATNELSWKLRFHSQTAGVSLTAQQPEVNIARTAIEALAGVLGGTQSLHTNSMDEALALPSEKAARIALRTQQVIAYETNVVNVADPLGGSWFVEELTDEMARQAEEIFAEISDMGEGSMLEGCIKGIEDNWFQGRIAESAYNLERSFNQGSRIVVGVNDFTEGNDDADLEILRITNEDERKQVGRLNDVRRDRDDARALVERALE